MKKIRDLFKKKKAATFSEKYDKSLYLHIPYCSLCGSEMVSLQTDGSYINTYVCPHNCKGNQSVLFLEDKFETRPASDVSCEWTAVYNGENVKVYKTNCFGDNEYVLNGNGLGLNSLLKDHGIEYCCYCSKRIELKQTRKKYNRGDCCEEIKREIERNNILIIKDSLYIYKEPCYVDDGDGYMDDITSGIKIKYCPFCGQKIENISVVEPPRAAERT